MGTLTVDFTTILKMKTIFVSLSLVLATSAAIQTEDRAGGLFGLGLLPFGGADTAAEATPAADNIGLLESLLTAQTTEDNSSTNSDTDIVQTLIDVLTGVTSVLPIEAFANLLGIDTTPVPSPISDPIGFLTHPLITPLILAAVTLNIPALMLAQGALAGSLLLTHLLTQQANSVET